MDSPCRSSSLRLTARERLLSIIDSVPGERKIVILDDWTVKVVDSICSLHEILDSGAFLVEIITKKRQPYPSMQAIYFISPSSESFDLIAKDFEKSTNRVPPYSEVHILATGRIHDEEMQKLASSRAVSHVKTLKEVYIDYLAIESRVFSLGSYSKLLIPGYSAQSNALSDLDKMAKQIASACITMKERPIVRYMRTGNDSLNQRLAAILNDILDSYCDGNADFRPKSSTSELIVVSRNFDMISPIVHEFTYQAMIMDLLVEQKLLVSGNRYKQGEKTVLLDEGDNLWSDLRHTHIADCSGAITKRFRQFATENKAASQQLSKKGPDNQGAEVVSLNQLKEVMGSLSEFQEQKAQFTLHMEIAEKCFAAMDDKNLMDVARVEQKLACGVDAEGHTVKDPWGQVAGILGRLQKLTSRDRARLLCIFFACTTQSTSEAEKRALIDGAKLAKCDSDAVKRYLGLISGHWKPGRGDRKSRFSREGEQEYEVSRFVPQLQLVAEDACRGALDPQLFPAISNTQSNSSQTARQLAATSLRAQRAGSSPVGGMRSATSASKSVWLFVIGGATWSEARAVYNTSKRTKVDCFLGSTHIINPNTFLDELGP
jgi:syntaxin-binding protein 1